MPETKTYLDLDGLTTYDGKIKQYVNNADSGKLDVPTITLSDSTTSGTLTETQKAAIQTDNLAIIKYGDMTLYKVTTTFPMAFVRADIQPTVAGDTTKLSQGYVVVYQSGNWAFNFGDLLETYSYNNLRSILNDKVDTSYIGTLTLTGTSGTLTQAQLTAITTATYYVLINDGQLFYKARTSSDPETGDATLEFEGKVKSTRINSQYTQVSQDLIILNLTTRAWTYTYNAIINTYTNTDVDALLASKADKSDIGYIELSSTSGTLTDAQYAETLKKYCIINYSTAHLTYYKYTETDSIVGFKVVSLFTIGYNITLEDIEFIVTKSTKAYTTSNTQETTYVGGRIDTLLANKVDKSDIGYVELSGASGTLTDAQYAETLKKYCIICHGGSETYYKYNDTSTTIYFNINSSNATNNVVNMLNLTITITKSTKAWTRTMVSNLVYDSTKVNTLLADKYDKSNIGNIYKTSTSGTLTDAEFIEAQKQYCIFNITTEWYYKITETSNYVYFARLDAGAYTNDYSINFKRIQVVKSTKAYSLTTVDPHFYSSSQVDTLLADKQLLINKNLYNLGAFDTYVDNNDGTITITRQTGHLIIDSCEQGYAGIINYQGYTSFGTDFYVGSDVVVGSWGNAVSGGSLYNSDITGYAKDIESAGNAIFAVSGCTTQTALNSYLSQHPLHLQYKLATSYTETVIKNQPLNTLDSKGSAWIQNEYEKTLQIWDGIYESNKYVNYADGSLVSASGYYATSFIPIKPNTTYYFSENAGSGGEYAAFYDNNKAYVSGNSYLSKNGTFTTPNGAYYIRITLETLTNVMLNEGSTALPYQPYNGAVIHQKQLDTKVDELDTKIEANAENIAGLTSTCNHVFGDLYQNKQNKLVFNPTVPSGVTPTALTGIKDGNNYYNISGGGGSSTPLYEHHINLKYDDGGDWSSLNIVMYNSSNAQMTATDVLNALRLRGHTSAKSAYSNVVYCSNENQNAIGCGIYADNTNNINVCGIDGDGASIFFGGTSYSASQFDNPTPPRYRTDTVINIGTSSSASTSLYQHNILVNDGGVKLMIPVITTSATAFTSLTFSRYCFNIGATTNTNNFIPASGYLNVENPCPLGLAIQLDSDDDPDYEEWTIMYTYDRGGGTPNTSSTNESFDNFTDFVVEIGSAAIVTNHSYLHTIQMSFDSGDTKLYANITTTSSTPIETEAQFLALLNNGPLNVSGRSYIDAGYIIFRIEKTNSQHLYSTFAIDLDTNQPTSYGVRWESDTVFVDNVVQV